jgi:NTE family protein
MGAPKPINVALQGGGSHGAFAWGVLDLLLEDERVVIEALSGASAGAVNAVIMAAGYGKGGREGARKALRDFWEALSDGARNSPLQRGPWEALMGGWSLDSSPLYVWLDMLSRIASPYDLNPLNWNPVRDLLESHVNFAALRRQETPKLFITATNVETGRARVFKGQEITCDHVMASACLPLLFQAVTIKGHPYWDGGYMGNPSLWPLFYGSPSDDIVIVQINPIERKGTPRASREILNRLNEITFNASLLSELRAIDFVGRLIKAGRLEGTSYRDIHVHVIEDDKLMSPLGESSKMLVERAFLDMLFESGRKSAKAWLEKHFNDLGERSTVDLRAYFDVPEDGLDRHPADPAPPAPPTSGPPNGPK